MPQFFSTERVKANSISTFCWMCFGGVLVELLVGEGFGEPRGVEAEVDADVAVLFEAGVVELGAEAEDADGGRLELPESVEGGGFVFGIRVFFGGRDWGSASASSGDQRSQRISNS